jgi:NTE family protein
VPPIQDLQMTMTSSNQERENLRFGLSLSDDFDGQSNYNFAVRYTRRAINPLGGQMDVQVQVGENNLLFGEWYQPLEAKGNWFIAPRMQYASFTTSPIDSSSGVQESEYQVRLAEGGIDLGYNLGFDTQMRIGYRGGVGDTKLDIGNPVDFPDDSFDLSYLQGGVAYDSLDDVNFPTKGERLLIIGTHSQTGFGASDDYDQARVNTAISRSWERNSFLLSSDAALNRKDDDPVPIQAQYLAGGFLNLSGYQQNSLLTNNYWINKILAYRRISSDGWLVSLPVHLGASFEMGSLESEYSEISLDLGDQIFAGSTFLGVDTFVGPLYLAYGQAEGGQRSLYFFLGRTF